VDGAGPGKGLILKEQPYEKPSRLKSQTQQKEKGGKEREGSFERRKGPSRGETKKSAPAPRQKPSKGGKKIEREPEAKKPSLRTSLREKG